MNTEKLSAYQAQFSSSWEKAQQVFPQCVSEADRLLSAEGVNTYIEKAGFLGKIGLGVEPCLIYLEEMPEIASHIDEASLQLIADYVYQLGRSPNRKSVIPFLESLRSICRRVDDMASLKHYISIIDSFIQGTETVIHGHNSLYESAGLVQLLESIPQLIGQLSLQGVANFVRYGVLSYEGAPEQATEYFSLKSADARAIIQRERHGVVFKDVERHLDMLKESLWDCELPFATFTTSFDQLRKPVPYLDEHHIAVPDMYDSENGIDGLDRYRAMLAHMMAHQHWSSKLMADNFAPHMQLFISTFEDCRVERLAMARYPGLKKYFLALHPVPPLGDCDSKKQACLRYRATRLSRALIDDSFDAEDELIETFRQHFNGILLEKGEDSSTEDMRELGTLYYVKSRLHSDSLPDVYFDHTEISYRDDNRCMWFHHEENDEAEDFHENEYESADNIDDENGGLPPRHYNEWDYLSESYRPDWTTVYERLHPAADAGDIDRLLEKHSELAKQLKKMIEMLKPQNRKRIRFQEEGEELDLDIALRSLIDFKNGSAPDPRINYSHITDSRNIAVMLLVDMSQSLNNTLQSGEQTLLQLSQESLAIMAWTVEQLGDRFAIAGFHSDTRHQVLYHHIKGYSEHYGEEVKSRLAAMQAGLSTRMGAAMRHAAHYLENQQAEKKLMLVLTDGEPSDIDSKDPRMLIEDTHRAVQELKQQGIYSYCINLDPRADEYVEDIFGSHYTIIDHVEKLPEQLPRVFMQLTH